MSPPKQLISDQDFWQLIISGNLQQFGEYMASTSPELRSKLLIDLAQNPSIPQRLEFINVLLDLPDTNIKCCRLEPLADNKVKIISPLHIAIEEKDNYLFQNIIQHPNFKLIKDTGTINDQDNIEYVFNLIQTGIRLKKPHLVKDLIKKDLRILQFCGTDVLESIFKEADIIIISGEQGALKREYTQEWRELLQIMVTALSPPQSTLNLHETLSIFLQDFFREIEDGCYDPKSRETVKRTDMLPLETLISLDHFNVNGMFCAGNYTLAIKIAANNLIDLMRFLKDKRPELDLNVQNQNGHMVSHYLRSIEMAKMVMTAGNINHVAGSIKSPLWKAIYNELRPDLIEYLIENGADLSFGSENILHVIPNYNYNKNLSRIERKNFSYKNFLERIFEKIPSTGRTVRDFLTQRDESYFTPIDSAVRSLFTNSFEFFLKKEKEVGIASFADGELMINAYKNDLFISPKYQDHSFVVVILKHLLSEERGSKNLVPMEILLELAEKEKASPPHREKEDHLKLLDTVIEKFQEPALNPKRTPKALINSDQTKISQKSLDQEPKKYDNNVENVPNIAAHNAEQKVKNAAKERGEPNTRNGSYSAPDSSTSSINHTPKTAINGCFKRFLAWIRELFEKVCNFFSRNPAILQKNKTNSNPNNEEIVISNASPSIQNAQNQRKEELHNKKF